MTKLKKELTYIDIVLATIGFVVGAGIYAVIGLTSGYAKEFTWLSVFICGFLSICTGFSYAELASIFNKNGGEFFYVKEAFNYNVAKIVGFLIIVVEMLVLNAVSFGMGDYLSTITKLPSVIIAGFFLVLFAYMNYSGIRSSANYNNISTLIEVGGLILISICGFKNVQSSSFDLTKITSSRFFSILMGASLIYFAYFGFDFIIELSEETKNADTVIPHAMMLGVIVSTILYVMVALSAVSSVGWKKLSTSKAPIADVATAVLGSWGYKLLFIIALVSMSNTILMGHVGISRFIQKIAPELKMPFHLEKIDEHTHTPKNAIIFITIFTLFSLLLGNLENSVKITNVFSLMVFFMVNISVIKLRTSIPDEKRKFKMPGNINNIPIPAIIGAVSSLLLIGVVFKN